MAYGLHLGIETVAVKDFGGPNEDLKDQLP
jgi:hypothetical protein